MRSTNLLTSAACAATLFFGSGLGLKAPGCGQINVFYTGLPPYHKAVTDQGWDPAMVAEGIKNSTIEMVQAGYNVRTVLAGPEQDMSLLANHMKDRHWDLTGIGYGVRAAKAQDVVELFEDLLVLFQQQGPLSRTVFNYNPTSFLWSIQRRIPLSSDCAGSPGEDLGYEIICDEMCKQQA